MSVTVTSQVTHLPLCHGIKEAPSGLLPLLSKHRGSLIDCIFALVIVRHTMSFKMLIINYHYYFFLNPQYLIPEGITNCYRRWNSGQHYECGLSHDAAAKLPRNKMELNRWMVTEIRWSRCEVSLASPVQSAIRRPSSSRKERPRSFIGPNVSKIIGQKQDVFESSTYFTILRSDAISVAPPAVTDVVWMYDAATVLTIDTSHVRFLPARHGMSV